MRTVLPIFRPVRRLLFPLICLIPVILPACRQNAESNSPSAAPEVRVVEVVQRDVPIYSEWVGTLDGNVNAQIRAQVTGYLLSRDYDEGAYVKKGTLLFRLDPSKFKAELDQAKGELGKAQAHLVKTRLDVQRDIPLAKQGAVSQKELQDSIQSHSAAKASVAAAMAAVEEAKLNLKWTRITAPIDGIVGIAEGQIGDLIERTTLLTSMSSVNPIRVYFPVSEQEYMTAAGRINQRYKARAKDPNATPTVQDKVELILSNGAVHPYSGQFILADRQVDIKTGTIRIAALFPNPGNILRPGQFARVRVVTETKQGALLVPQRAVTELQGTYQIAVISPDNLVEIRPIKVGERVDNLWIVDEGLHPNEQVVAEGVQKLKEGMAVTPQPFTPPSEKVAG